MKKIINRTNGKVLGSIIKINRLHQNMSQKALSEGICVSSYLSRIENAEIIPSEQVISELFEALAIYYDDSEAFIESGQELLDHFLDELMFNEFATSQRIFEAIESQAERFRHSPLIIDYTIAKLAFYCTRHERNIFESTRSLLASVEELMQNDQRFKYYLYYGIDYAKVNQDYNGALSIFNQAANYGSNGHLFYWLGYVHLALGNHIKAFEQFNLAMDAYVKEANLLSVIATYEMLGLTFYRAGHYTDGLDYFTRGLKIVKKIGAQSSEASFLSNIAWGHLKLGNHQTALQTEYARAQCFTSETGIHYAIIELLANLEMENSLCVNELLPTFNADDSPLMVAFAEVMNHPDSLNWADKLIDHEGHLKELIGKAQPLNFELTKHLKEMLQRLYREKRRYKEALELKIQ